MLVNVDKHTSTRLTTHMNSHCLFCFSSGPNGGVIKTICRAHFVSAIPVF